MSEVIQVRSQYRMREWAKIIQEYEASGLSNKEFCEQNGVSIKSYYYWLRKLREAAMHQNQPSLVQLTSTTDECNRIDDMIHIQFRSARLDLPGNTDAEAVIAILRSLQSFLEGFSEYYSKNLARETRKGLRETALEARYTGGNVLYGYYIGEDQKYHINEEEAVVVRKIFDCCESQCGYGGLLEELRNKGIHTRQGRVFTASTFYYILKNRRYTGDYVYSPVGNLKEHRSQPIIVENAIPAIVSKPQWEKVQAILHKRQTKGMVTAREPYLLSGLLFCGECGSPMSGHRSRKKKNGGEYVYYSYECQAKVRKHACRKRCVPRDEIETKILDYVKMLFSQQSVAYIQNYIRTHANELNLDILTQQEQLRKSAEKLDRKIDNTIELLIDSPSDRLREKLDELEAQRRKIDYQIDELNTHKIDSDMLKDYIVEVRSLENMSHLELQQIIRKIIKKVTIYEDGHYDGFSVFYTENGGATQNRTGDQGVAVHCLTAWLWHHMERMTRLELATSTLARWRSTR